ncbi:MAG: peptide chain release factor 2 [Anaerotignum faecicola]|uniref:peptide chain release factor 2 n=1 Tax=Clostridia TaxID=186801 RepID=UPI000E48CC2C|nr:peptide chain release factor 2 [Anaerotignum faecicola]MBE5722526.1 peptide chain release factor 2 [Clostridium sp.]MBS5031733.1 peptide chain release factor 2 [Bacillota bacterium]MBT9766080.1 peptide chain release factor 2 [Clostridium sp. MCC345]RHR15213.1 peptide chain release factor 2 [Firmicutes bacterium AF19-2LB]RHT40845.1 peptide chain release factor 2 [Firmicutes bacterium AM29-6AC]HAX34581.1 peptide chain release factor 2 [Tyzzerella sp.]
MFELEQIRLGLSAYDEKLKEMGASLDVAGAKEKINELEELSADPDFWNDLEKSQKTLQKLKALKNKVGKYEGLVTTYEDILTLIEMGIEEQDDSVYEEVKEMNDSFLAEYEALRIATMLDGEYDRNNAIVTLHAGTGGTEACDWTNMLFRMYSRWAQKEGFEVEVLDMLDGDEAGLKSVTIQVNGENAYGYLKSEKGIHRLVRVSPFDSAGRRQTSFASCDVMPEIEDDTEIEIKPDDIRIDTYRASGAGGQHINKTSSAIRITHFPTGVVVSCQEERSQFANKDKAFKMLRSKLLALKIEEQMQKLAEIRGDVKEIGWGSQIRSYIFMPYTLVKDHRTGEETGKVDAVMDGEIDNFISAYLAWIHS